ncbi:MAG TPA: hypothetical protein VGJ05_17055, partial [Fimbriiglobus sp.]
KIVARIRTLAEEGHRDEAIARQLDHEGFTPCRGAKFTPLIVLKLRGRYKLYLGLERIRRGMLPVAYTIAALARRLRVDPAWIYRGIAAKRIQIDRDPIYGCYLFPRSRETVQQLRRLHRQEVPHITFPKGHHNG